MQTLLQQPPLQMTIRSGTVAMGPFSPHHPRPRLLSLSPPNFLISLKSGKSKPLLSPLASYDPVKLQRSKLFGRRVSSSSSSPSFTSPDDETDKAHLDQEEFQLAADLHFREFLRQFSYSSHFKATICHYLANHVLHKHTAKGSNTLISPVSFHLLLSLIAAGSKGHTLEQLLKRLKSKSLEGLNSQSSEITYLASPANESDPDLSLVNGVWVGEGLKLKPSFQESVEATAKEVDFISQADQIVAETTATRGHIKNLLTSEASKSIDGDTALVLANALDFKATWAQCFDTSKTENRPFYLEKGQTVHVPFMIGKNCGSFHYMAINNYKILKLPFKNGQSTRKYSMYFFLPNAVDGLQDFVEELERVPGFFTEDFGLPLQDITDIWIPRFKFSFEFEASDAMKGLGLNLPFDSTKAEITEMVDSSRSLHVKKMFHKAFIEVNEEGMTQATARTAATFRPLEVNRERTAEVTSPAASTWKYKSGPFGSFVADHPFLFMIKEDTSGVVLFIGTVVNPLSEC
ncbi:hypothetical protein PTKIN_Ptkin06aG0003800 [Pterospermum kingtungense]